MWSLLAVALAAPPRTRLDVPADDGHPLALWAEVPDHPRAAVLLLHGRTWSSAPDFDLEVPGTPSTMDALADAGLAVYALDLRGYGGTPRDASGWNTPDRAAADLATAAAFVAGRHGGRPPTVVGWSLGALVAQLFAQRHPELLSGLVVYGYPRDPAKPVSSDDGPPADSPPPRRPNTAEAAASDFVTPGAIAPDAVAAYVAAALAADPIRADWRGWRQLAELDPAKVTVPTLILHGQLDPTTSFVSQEHLFTALGTPARSWVELAGGDHAAHLERCGPAFVHAVVSFVDAPRGP